MNRKRIRVSRSQLMLLAGLTLLLYVSLSDTLQGPDSTNYLVLVRSLAMDGDLFLANELEAVERGVFVGPLGYPLDIHNLGVTLFWMPFYLIGHAITSLFALTMRLSGVVIELNGLTSPYAVWLRFADWVYGFLALYLIQAALRFQFSARSARFATLAITVGSSFGYYWLRLSPGSHMVSVFLSALFLYGFFDESSTRTWKRWLGLGVVAGWALSVANTNIALLAFPLVYFGTQRPSRRWLLEVGSFGVSYCFAFAPQMLAWWLFNGSPLTPSYTSQLAWTQPELWNTLFSSYHGLFSFAPLLLGAVVGLMMLGRREWRLALACLLAIGITAYLSSINLAWWGGGSFGNRYLLGSTPFFAVGLAVLADRFKERWQGRILVALTVGAMMWTFLLYLPYPTLNVSLVAYFTWQELVAFIAQAVPQLPRLLYSAVFAPSTWVVAFLPLFVLIVWGVVRQRHRLLGIPSLLERRTFLLLPLLFVIFVGGAALRSRGARDACVAAGCDRAWIPSRVDQWDLAYTYVERAEYYRKRGEWEAALADLRTAVEVYPTDARLRQLLAEAEQSIVPDSFMP